jgi:TATA-box binding protein (TBP) (component of TFIID and TFIIIB)
MLSLNNEWFQFVQQQKIDSNPRGKTKPVVTIQPTHQYADEIAPEGNKLNISTKTMILQLNNPIDTNEIFWKIPIMEYWCPREGVVHKYMQMISNTPDDLVINLQKLEQNPYPYKEYITKQVNNKNKKVAEFKDSRKIVMGINRKNILNGNKKEKKSFMNSFALMIRFEFRGIFKEVHAKIFNTGKMVIPGILCAEMFVLIQRHILDILQPYFDVTLAYITPSKESVIVNSDFNCGFHILRNELFDIMKHKYKLDASFCVCTYPGVKCRFYYNHNRESDNQNGILDVEDYSFKLKEIKKNKKYTCVTFTIFRTGSCIVTGNCNDEILHHVCHFLKTILKEEYHVICARSNSEMICSKKKTVVLFKTIHRKITVT